MVWFLGFLPVMIATLRSEIRLTDVVRSLLFNRGYTAKLESELTRYFGVQNSLLTHSGRTGLYFLLKALPHRKVYLPAYNCWAVTEAASRAGKEIESVDIRLEDFNMDVAKLRSSLAADSIIVATHQFGIPCDIDGILELARERDCIVLEDNAPAIGSEVAGRKTGSFGTASIVSFDHSKAIVSGKGGAILFTDDVLYQRVKKLHDETVAMPGPFQSLRYMLVALAYSYATHKWVYRTTYALFRRIRGCSKSEPAYDLTGQNPSYLLGCDEMRAKVAYLGMKRLAGTLSRREKIVDFYREITSGNERIIAPVIPDGCKAALLKFPIRLDGFDRDFFYARCLAKGVDIGFLFPFHYQGADDDCPNARAAASQAMSLPVHGALGRGDLDRIKNALADEKSYLAASPVK